MVSEAADSRLDGWLYNLPHSLLVNIRIQTFSVHIRLYLSNSNNSSQRSPVFWGKRKKAVEMGQILGLNTGEKTLKA